MTEQGSSPLDIPISEAFGQGGTRPEAWSLEFQRPDEMARVLRGAEIDYLTLAGASSAARYSARLSVIELGGITVQHVEDDAHLAIGMIRPDRQVLLFPLGGARPGLAVNGHAFGNQDVMLLGPASDVRSVSRTRQRWAAIALDPLSGLTDEALVLRRGAFAALEGLLARTPSLATASEEVAHLARFAPDRVASGSVARAMVQHWSMLFERALAPSDLSPSRALASRMRLVVAAEEWLHAMIGQPVYTHELAAALGTSARSLHAAFRAVFDMSVHRYLHVRRLNLVHAALRRGGGGDLVKTIAIHYGFWHLGRFATDYRCMFGEPPSVTLAAARWPPLDQPRAPRAGAPEGRAEPQARPSRRR